MKSCVTLNFSRCEQSFNPAFLRQPKRRKGKSRASFSSQAHAIKRLFGKPLILGDISGLEKKVRVIASVDELNAFLEAQ
jgi:hypothetical protein